MTIEKCSGSRKLARQIVHSGNCPDCGGVISVDDSRVADHLPRPSTMGRDDYLMEQIARGLRGTMLKTTEVTDIARADSRRGYRFDVKVRVGGEATGHIARVTVELDRMEQT